jgi:hypothetical protein
LEKFPLFLVKLETPHLMSRSDGFQGRFLGFAEIPGVFTPGMETTTGWKIEGIGDDPINDFQSAFAGVGEPGY